MARIKHIAFFVQDPQKLADFYVDVFGMKITRKGKDDKGNPVSVWVTDGYMDVALIQARGKMKPGINHFGWTLDAAEKAGVKKKLKNHGIDAFDPRAGSEVSNRPYVEEGALDIEGNRFDLSTGMNVNTPNAGKLETESR
jgi:catechol 2,3-dioxygenase-like lactoylglutathione lyase family enzyme